MKNQIALMEEMQERINRLLAENPDGSGKPVIYNCQICNDQEGLIVKQPFKDSGVIVETWIECICIQKRRLAKLFSSSYISPDFRNKTFANFTLSGRPECVHDAYEAALSYHKDFQRIRNTAKNSFALLGSPGGGKTHLLMALANALMSDGVQVLYFPWIEGWNEIRGNPDAFKKVEALQRAEVLFIDDLFKGREKPTEFQMEQFFAVVNFRYLNLLPMIISSERDFDMLCDPQMGDEALGSRLFERCSDYTVVLQGNDLNYRLNG